MTQPATIADVLSRTTDLRETLDDLNVQHVAIASSGAWTFEKLGRIRSGGDPLHADTVRDLAALVPHGRHLRHAEWAIRRLDGVGGPSLLIERLPVAIADRLPHEILSVLKKQVRARGNGALIGPPGSGKAALMLWLALQIPDETVIFVSENPPAQFPGSHIIHVFPPTTAGERRVLERFVRLSATVMWDRISSTDDLSSLFGFPGAKRRWFSLDASNVGSALRRLTGAVQHGCDASFSAILSLTTSVIGRPEPQNLAIRTAGRWTEPFLAGDSCLEALDAFDALSRIGAVAPTAPERGEAATAAPSVDEVADAHEAAAGDVEEPDAIAASDDGAGGPLTIEIDEEDAQPQDDAVTGMLMRDELEELREQQLEILEDDDLPSPFKIDDKGNNVAEVTRAYTETPAEVGFGRAELNQRVTSHDDTLDHDDPPPRAEQEVLRTTAAGSVDEAELLRLYDVYEEVDYDHSEIGDDFSGVFDADLDLESLAEQMLSEISDGNIGAIGATDPEQPVLLSEDDLELIDPDESDATIARSGEIVSLARGMKVPQPGEEESTKEFQLDDKLKWLRRDSTTED